MRKLTKEKMLRLGTVNYTNLHQMSTIQFESFQIKFFFHLLLHHCAMSDIRVELYLLDAFGKTRIGMKQFLCKPVF